MLEREIETKVKEYARSKGWLAYKFTSPGHSFVPDGLFISPTGVVIFMEFKQLGKKPTPGQEREIARIIEHHTPCFVVDNVEYGKEIIDAYAR
jgi:hypothetical protein